MPLVSRNPATGEVFGTFEELTDAEMDARLAKAQKAFEAWRHVSFAERKTKMLKLAVYLKANSRVLGELATREMGKPIKAAIGEVEKCAWACEYYAENAEKILARETIETDAGKSYARFDPIGVVLAIMPWNFPFWQVMRFASPAAMAGNVGVLKHASNVPQCAAAIEKAFLEAGFPEGVFQNFAIGAAKVERVIRDPRVVAVTLTGSEPAGSKVASLAGSLIKKTVLELGGSDPFIILEDADVEQAALVATTARVQNNGQSCIAAKRFIVAKSVADKFLAAFKQHFEKLKVGDPLDETVQVGPLASENGLKDIEAQVQKSVAMGAKIVTGGTRVYPLDLPLTKGETKRGYFYAPTILTDLKPGMPAYGEELFAPVASVIIVKDEEEAIRVANATEFGLGAALWTKDTKRAETIAARLEAGCIFVNGMVKSDPRLPFGGIKKSGYGRELSGYGIKEFVNIKSVWIAKS
jgi:succinate-semialdehyde dehydrogenase/glutarate-semialdehyde dehydrogenase